MRKSIIILSAFFVCNVLLTGIYSCTKTYDDGCGGKNGWEADNRCSELNSATVTLVNSQYQPIFVGSEVKATDVVLEVTFNEQAVTCKANKVVNPFITAAYACTPPPPTYFHKDGIVQVSITSNNNYDDSHAAGSDLSAYFEIPTLEKLNEVGVANGDINDFETNHHIALKQAPQFAGKYNFTIQYHLASGAIVEATSGAINITK